MASSQWFAELLAPTHTSEWISGLSGIVGAILGGIVTMAMTEWFNRRARKRNDIERKAQVAFATFQRLNQIYSVTLSIESHLREGIERAQQARSYNFLTTQALQRMAAPIYFPVEEIWTLTQIGGADLGNSVGSLDHAFNLLLNALDDYGVKRDVLMNEMPPPTRAEGYKGTMEVDETEILRLTPQIGALELAIEQLHPMAQRLALEAFEALCGRVPRGGVGTVDPQ